MLFFFFLTIKNKILEICQSFWIFSLLLIAILQKRMIIELSKIVETRSATGPETTKE